MIIKQYQYGPEKTNSYLIISDRHAILVDAPSEEIIYEVEKLNVALDYVILTHEHADHLWGLNAIREKFRCKVIGQKICSKYIQDCRNNKARYYHVYYAMKYKENNTGIFDPLYCCEPVDIEFDETLNLLWQGNELQIIHAPGHSEGSVLIVLNDSDIFSGDTILKEQQTFTGFTNGSEEEYQKYTKPIIEKINDNKRIYPGHGTYFKFIEWKNGGIKNEQ